MKIDLDNGKLDERGQSSDFVFVKIDLDAGKYEIEITDGPGDLYEIKGTAHKRNPKRVYACARNVIVTVLS